MSRTALAMGMLFLSPSLLAETSYICTGNMAAGIFFDKKTKQWDGGSIENPEKKYIISKPDKAGPDKDYAWLVREIGGEIPISHCREDFINDGKLFCPSFYDMRFNKINGRFLLIYWTGYWTDSMDAKEGESFSEGADMPHMIAGKCSPF
jgi:hypothetical protein